MDKVWLGMFQQESKTLVWKGILLAQKRKLRVWKGILLARLPKPLA